eukprot:CAMPEP_0116831558 /NCGR_PEP_ID=MMETSP0418-20121206/5405_1 /TAXON_ID=1158023 /ORGANISM="Astrosyne radiata, Strain 13vi08-1A" /LENGTH=187 /DNA_ID=CAMNT_0004460825 /DNA_START=203 /DNA_END=766 /DNA_ORIENTATION=+
MNTFRTHFSEYLAFAYMGFGYYWLYMQAGKRQDRRNLSRIVRKFEKWVKVGVENCRPLFLLLRAFQIAQRCKGKNSSRTSNYKDTKAAFDDAIEQLSKGSFLRYEAIANEQFALIALGCKDHDEARKYMLQSVALLKRHCFHEKVDWLFRRHVSLLSNEQPMKSDKLVIPALMGRVRNERDSLLDWN